MVKPQTVSRRANSYALRTTPNDAYDRERSAEGWAKGYRAAMRDMRALINGQALDVFLSMRLRKFINDTARLR